MGSKLVARHPLYEGGNDPRMVQVFSGWRFLDALRVLHCTFESTLYRTLGDNACMDAGLF